MRVNAVIDELHEQLLIVSMRAAQQAQATAELLAQVQTLQDENAQQRAQIERLTADADQG